METAGRGFELVVFRVWKLVLLGGSCDLVSWVISTLIGVISIIISIVTLFIASGSLSLQLLVSRGECL